MSPSERGRRAAGRERPRQGRAAGLDGLRGVAALSVVCFHVWLYRFPDPSHVRRRGPLDYALSDLRLGLILFFVLSGYLLYRGFARAALRRDGFVDVRLYLRRRLARVVPAYYLAMLGTLVLLWGARNTPGVRLPAHQSDLALFAFFAQNYSSHTLLTLNPVTWTLCLEVLFYALLPLLGVLAYRWSGGGAGRQAAALCGLIGLGLLWNAGVYLAGGGMVASKALPAYLPYFALGMLLALWVERHVARRGERPRLGAPATLAVAGLGVLGVVGNAVWHSSGAADAAPLVGATVQNLPAGVGFSALVAAVVAGRGAAAGWSRFRPLAALGVVSYGVYLWHLPLMLFGKRLDLLPHAFLPRLVVVLVPAVAVGTLSWLLVERTMLGLASRSKRPSAGARRRIGAALEARAAP
jgi:peptidoglycan/LPS O-acetylase OafA/YrhL